MCGPSLAMLPTSEHIRATVVSDNKSDVDALSAGKAFIAVKPLLTSHDDSFDWLINVCLCFCFYFCCFEVQVSYRVFWNCPEDRFSLQPSKIYKNLGAAVNNLDKVGIQSSPVDGTSWWGIKPEIPEQLNQFLILSPLNEFYYTTWQTCGSNTLVMGRSYLWGQLIFSCLI